MIKDTVRSKQIAAIIFYLGFMLELAILIVDQSDFLNPIEGRLFQITFVIFGIKVLMTRYTGREWFLIFVFGVLGGISYLVTDRNELIRLVMMIAASKSMHNRDVLKVTFYTVFISGAVLVILSVLGLYGTQALIADYGRGGIETRYCFGFGHPNALHCIFWFLVVLGIYLYYDRMRWYWFAVLFAANILLMILTASRAGFIITALTVAAAAGIKYLKFLQNARILYALAIVAVAGALIFSFMAAYSGIEWKPLAILNEYLNNRIILAYEMGSTDTWSLWGNADHVKYFDMGFVRIFYWYGIVFGMMYPAVNLMMLNYFYKAADRMAMIVIAVVTVYTIVEAFAISVYLPRNIIFLLLLGTWGGIFGVCGGKERYFWRLLGRKQ